MRLRDALRTLTVLGALLWLFALGGIARAGSSAGDLRVFAGYALAAPLQQLAARFEQTSGHRLIFHYGTAPQLVQLIRGADSFDLIVVPAEVLQDPAARARLAPSGSVVIAHIGLAVATRAGGPRPDIATEEGFRRTLLQARSLATIPASATGVRILQLLRGLGILDSVRPKMVAAPTPAQLVRAVASGRAELGLFLSNVLTAPGVEVLGPFPPPLQQNIVFRAALGAHAPQAGAAQDFIRYLQSPAAAAVFRSQGVMPGGQ